MATKKNELKIYFDPIGNTMNIWWGNPNDAYETEEVDSKTRNDVITKDKYGNPIGIEIIGILPEELNISEKIQNALGKKQSPFLLSN